MVGLVLTISCSENLERWTFRDGTSVNEELKDIDLHSIRAVCAHQSRTQWTSIASRHRLYQFMALSDEVTQKEMREKVSSLIDLNGSDSMVSSLNGSGSLMSSLNIPQGARGLTTVQALGLNQRGTKR
jgi:hypothetical protein